ncbi:MAG: sulfotransferase domain-containing protein [Chloroflexota bacterium]
MEERGRLPNFLCIGAPRSGTTWLYQSLRAHPEAFVPKDKEITFFVPFSYRSSYWNGIEWYKSHFDFENDGSIKVWGELSPRYYFSEGTPELIKKTIPDVKLVFLLRNPAEMLYSVYMYHVKMYLYTIDANRYMFHDFLDHHAVEPLGFFAKHLKSYYQYFARDAILVRFYEDLKRNPPENFKAIATFLNIDPSFDIPHLEERVNTAVIPRHYTFSLISSYLPKWLPFRAFLSQLEKRYNRTEYRGKRNNGYITPEIFSRLMRAYQKDIHELEETLNVDLSQWLVYEALEPSTRQQAFS